MSAKANAADPELVQSSHRRPAYDPSNLHPLDEEDRKHDPQDGIDYDEIIATTQDDWLSGNYLTFDPNDYATEEECLDAIMEALLEPA